jgi:hypothetical protein
MASEDLTFYKHLLSWKGKILQMCSDSDRMVLFEVESDPDRMELLLQGELPGDVIDEILGRVPEQVSFLLDLFKNLERDIAVFSNELFPELNIPEDLDFNSYLEIAQSHEPLTDLLGVTFQKILAVKDLRITIAIQLIRDDLRDEVERRKQAKDKKRESSKFPEIVPAQTSEEIKYGLRAITDGKTLQNWTRSPFETACIHAIPGAPFEIKLFTIGDDETHETLEAIIKEFSSPVAALFCQFIFNSVLIHERSHLELDSLIRELGLEVRTTADRQKHRARVFGWIELLSRLGCFGERYKPYYDSFTGNKKKIYSKGRYIYLGDPYFTDEQ